AAVVALGLNVAAIGIGVADPIASGDTARLGQTLQRVVRIVFGVRVRRCARLLREIAEAVVGVSQRIGSPTAPAQRPRLTGAGVIDVSAGDQPRELFANGVLPRVLAETGPVDEARAEIAQRV